jgi:hypothetical protein
MTMTETRPDATALWVDLPAAELIRALKNAKLFAGATDRPVIAQTQVTFTATGLQLVTTDSFALLIENVPCSVPAELVNIVRYLTVGDAGPLFAVLKAAGKHARAYLKVGNGLDAGGHVAATLEVGDGVTGFAFAAAGAYPEWERLFDRDKLFAGGMVEMAGPLGLGLPQIKRIGSIVPDGSVSTPAKFHNVDAGGLKPVGVTIGEDIVIIQMPVRIS